MAKKKKKTSRKKNITQKTAMQTSAHDKTAAKKAAVLGTEPKSRLPLFAMIAGVALVIGGTYYLIPGNSPKTVAVSTQPSPEASISQVTYPVGLFDDGKARHFHYKDGDITVKYFILKSSDGVLRAAFDACDVCWPAGKGYYQDGDDMVCRNCGRRFASVLVNVVQGGCNPAPLNRNIVNGQLVIKVSDIQQGGKQFFNFSRRT